MRPTPQIPPQPELEKVTLSGGAIIHAGIHSFSVALESPVPYSHLTEEDREEAWSVVNKRCTNYDRIREQAQSRWHRAYAKYRKGQA